MLIRIAFRNLLLHRKRSFIVGSLLMLGAWLVVVGQATLDAIQGGLERSVVDSLSGHLQLQSEAAPDTLELYQSAALAQPDLGQIDDFGRLKAALTAMPEVASVVPMGLSRSIVSGSSVLETKLTELRRAVDAGKLAETAPLVAHVRRLIGRLERELDELRRVAADTEDTVRQAEDLKRANDDAFWRDFAADPEASIGFLENRIAPLGLQTGLYFVGFVGTDIHAFANNFKLFDVIEGSLPAPGQRGFLFSTVFYERFAKHRTARRLDQMREARDLEDRRIDDDTELKRMVERNVGQVAQITDQLDADQSAALRAELLKELGGGAELEALDLDGLVGRFLTMSDADFERRYDFFYRHIAPRIRLYAFSVGDELVLYGQTRSGYPRVVKVPVTGVYRLKGLEKSTLAGAYNMMDLMTFRDLYGLSGGVAAADVKAIQAKAAVAVVDAANAEDALFGEDAEIVAEVDNQGFDELSGHDLEGLRRAAEAEARRPFTQAELEGGPTISAAVFLKDKSDLKQSAAIIRAKLGEAGIGVRALTWEEARGEAVSGVSVGITVIFYGVVVIVFLVALVVIINSLLMSTTERTREIGTMRAIGAQRGFVVRMFTVEALVTALLFGGFGVVLGAITVLAVGATGIAATSEIQFFVFGGASLHPELAAQHIFASVLAVAVVTTVACFIPARIASGIAPVTAMQVRD